VRTDDRRFNLSSCSTDDPAVTRTHSTHQGGRENLCELYTGDYAIA